MRAIRAAQGETAGTISADALRINVPKPKKVKTKAPQAEKPASEVTNTLGVKNNISKISDNSKKSNYKISEEDYEYGKEFVCQKK